MLEVILQYVHETAYQVYWLLNDEGLERVVGASPFWIIVCLLATSAIISIMARINMGIFGETNGGK